MALNVALVANESGDRFVQFDLNVGPLFQRIIAAPDLMENILNWAAENIPPVIAEARQQNNMRGFQVVTDLPTLPPLGQLPNGGVRGHG